MGTTRTKSATGLLSRGTIPTSLVDSVLRTCASPNTRESYAKGIADLYAFAAGRPVTSGLLYDWRLALSEKLSTGTVNARLTAVRCLVRHAQRIGFIDSNEAFDLLGVEGLPFRGTRMGNWLTLAQRDRLLSVPAGKDLRALRNKCILSIFAGTAIRLEELATLHVETIQQREGRWVFADLVGKGGRVRTVAIPRTTKLAIDAWTKAAKITEGRLIRQLTLKPEGLSTDGIRDIVKKAAQKIGVKDFAPHDLRRTCARLCREAGGDLIQIQAMLGHASLVTTQRYLGTVQNLRTAVNDNIGM